MWWEVVITIILILFVKVVTVGNPIIVAYFAGVFATTTAYCGATCVIQGRMNNSKQCRNKPGSLEIGRMRNTRGVIRFAIYLDTVFVIPIDDLMAC